MTQLVQEREVAPIDTHDRRSPTASGSWRRRVWAIVLMIGVLAALFATVAGDREIVKPDGAALVGNFFAAPLHPLTDGTFLMLTANATVTTLSYAVLGTALSLVLGLFGGVLMSEVWWLSGRRRGRIGWLCTRTAMVIPRGIHEVVWGLLFLAIFGIEPIVAVLAIGVPFGAVTAKVFSELLDEADRRPFAALVAAGSGRRAAILYGLLRCQICCPTPSTGSSAPSAAQRSWASSAPAVSASNSRSASNLSTTARSGRCCTR